ncbi:MAG: hypothetical protein KDA99_03475, partial [Planctomycetales bacterium]|nr:hypothetical protein [Planctomycetales bacterium]
MLSASWKGWSPNLAWALSITITMTLTVTVISGQPTLASDAPDYAQHVAQLGHSEFLQRELASQTLTEIGTAALPALSEGATSLDREIRMRSQRLIEIIRAADRTEKLRAFLQHDKSVNEDSLTAWNEFREVVGGDEPARLLYAKMAEHEYRLLEASSEQPAEIVAALAIRCKQLEANSRQPSEVFRPESIAALLFVAGQPGLTLTDNAGLSIYRLSTQHPTFRQYQEHPNAEEQAYLKLLGRWIAATDDASTMQPRLAIAAKLRLDSAIPLALKMLEQENLPPRVRQSAVLTIAKLGTADHVPVLERQFEDHSVASRVTHVKTKKIISCEIRDAALLAVLHLSNQSLED